MSPICFFRSVGCLAWRLSLLFLCFGSLWLFADTNLAVGSNTIVLEKRIYSYGEGCADARVVVPIRSTITLDHVEVSYQIVSGNQVGAKVQNPLPTTYSAEGVCSVYYGPDDSDWTASWSYSSGSGVSQPSLAFSFTNYSYELGAVLELTFCVSRSTFGVGSTDFTQVAESRWYFNVVSVDGGGDDDDDDDDDTPPGGDDDDDDDEPSGNIDSVYVTNMPHIPLIGENQLVDKPPSGYDRVVVADMKTHVLLDHIRESTDDIKDFLSRDDNPQVGQLENISGTFGDVDDSVVLDSASSLGGALAVGGDDLASMRSRWNALSSEYSGDSGFNIPILMIPGALTPSGLDSPVYLPKIADLDSKLGSQWFTPSFWFMAVKFLFLIVLAIFCFIMILKLFNWK